MAALINEFPFPWSRPEARDLHIALATIYPDTDGALYVAESIGIKRFNLKTNQTPFFLWRDILDKAALASATEKLVKFVLEQQAGESSTRVLLEKLLAGKPSEMPQGKRDSSGRPVFISGNDTVTVAEAKLFHDDLTIPIRLVPQLITTLQKMLELSPGVCKLDVRSDGGWVRGTGFRIGRELIMTNHHVLFGEGTTPVEVVAVFGYDVEVGREGASARAKPCNASPVLADEEDDWAIVRVAEAMDESWPILRMDQAAEPMVGEGAFILQHPGGEPKRLGFMRNMVSDLDERVVHYLTDTDQGASGAPVLNAQGQLIALHHSGGVPTKVAGKLPIAKNEGIRIDRIYRALTQANIFS